MLLLSWVQVEAAADRIMSGDGVIFDVSTIANAKDLLKLCRSHCSLPEVIAKGYWTTLSISWPKFELEVFEDRVEVYLFEVPSGTDIWYEPHSPGQDFSARFIDALPKHKATWT